MTGLQIGSYSVNCFKRKHKRYLSCVVVAYKYLRNCSEKEITVAFNLICKMT